MSKQKKLMATIGLLVWLLLVLCFWPNSPLSLDYVRILLVAAPLLIIPFCVSDTKLSTGQIMVAGVLFGLGMLLPQSWYATIMVLPWMAFAAYLCWQRLKQVNSWSLTNIMELAQSLFLFTAACWALADRMTLTPLGFTGDIVLLTAVHFHYAGFTLTWLATNVKTLPDWTRWGIVSGVGLVAIGITSSQIQLPAWIEVLSVTILAIAALRMAWALLFIGEGGSRFFFWFAALALSIGMLLALTYGWRYYFPIPALNIPVMYAIHGSLNSLGFALPAIWAYLLDSSNDHNLTPSFQ